MSYGNIHTHWQRGIIPRTYGICNGVVRQSGCDRELVAVDGYPSLSPFLQMFLPVKMEMLEWKCSCSYCHQHLLIVKYDTIWLSETRMSKYQVLMELKGSVTGCFFPLIFLMQHVKELHMYQVSRWCMTTIGGTNWSIHPSLRFRGSSLSRNAQNFRSPHTRAYSNQHRQNISNMSWIYPGASYSVTTT